MSFIYRNRKVAGVWVDHQEALIISTPNKMAGESFNVIEKLKTHHHGDHGSSEHKHQHKAKTELHHYYEEITRHIEPYDALYLIGPGKAQEELRNFLGTHKAFAGKEIKLGTANHLTTNQMIAEVKKHFSS